MEYLSLLKKRELIPLFKKSVDLKERSIENIRDDILLESENQIASNQKEPSLRKLTLLNTLFNNYKLNNNYLTLISSLKQNKIFNFIIQNSINEFNSEFMKFEDYTEKLSKDNLNTSILVDGRKLNIEEYQEKLNNLLFKGEILNLELENLLLNKKIEILQVKIQKLGYKYSLIKKIYIFNSLSLFKQNILNSSNGLIMNNLNVLKIEETIKDLAKIYFGNPKLEKEIVKDIISLNNNSNINNRKENQSIILNQYIKSMTLFNKKHHGISMMFTQIMTYNFNYWKNHNKIILSNLYKFLQSTFISMNCLISKPIFIITNDKVEIQLFYFLLWNNNFKRITIKSNLKQKLFRKVKESQENLKDTVLENKDNPLLNQKHNLSLHKLNVLKKKRNNSLYRFIKMNYKLLKFKNNSIKILRKNFLIKNSQKFKTICQILSRYFKKPVELNLIRLHYPYYDTNILVNFLAFNIKKIKVRLFLSRLFKFAVIKKPFNIKDSFDNSNHKTKNKILVVPSFLSGLKIRIAGRLMTQPVIPRRTVYTTFRGTSSKGKINFSDTARFTNKNKRGAYTISITAGQNFI